MTLVQLSRARWWSPRWGPPHIHISNAVARLGREFHAQVEQMFPDALGAPAEVDDAAAERQEATEGRAVPVRARADGYIQYVDTSGLIGCAKEQGLVVELRHRPGDFVNKGRILALVRPEAHVSDETIDAVQSAVVIGGYQSQAQARRCSTW